eukprot:snap_masked-scaffold_21-processed-gene-5.49-mRNA-1 protein AED:1.00 eAED:1.00 QI:0/0/0/0/1/1/2/0/104
MEHHSTLHSMKVEIRLLQQSKYRDVKFNVLKIGNTKQEGHDIESSPKLRKYQDDFTDKEFYLIEMLGLAGTSIGPVIIRFHERYLWYLLTDGAFLGVNRRSRDE